MKINSKDFQIRQGSKVELEEYPTDSDADEEWYYRNNPDPTLSTSSDSIHSTIHHSPVNYTSAGKNKNHEDYYKSYD